MQREIHFRYWNKELDSLSSYILSIYITMDMNGSLWFQDESMEKPIDVTSVYLAEQYTGRTDKNGIEIYDGDILFEEGPDKYWEVVYRNGSFKIKRIGQTLGFGSPSKGYTVVGNIHENPELLEAKQ